MNACFTVPSLADLCCNGPKQRRLIIRIERDDDCPNPMTDCDGQWTLHSFSRRHYNFKDPDELGLGTNPGLRRKMQVGLAFVLSYYEHGNSLWMLKDGRTPAGVEFQWDGTRVAGLLIWDHKPGDMGAKSYEDRAKDAQGFLDEYNEWCNGNCYGYSIETEDGEHVDSCWGFIGSDVTMDYMFDQISESTEDAVVKVEGDGAWLADHHEIKCKEAVEDFDDE